MVVLITVIFTLKMKAAGSSETLVRNSQTSRRHIKGKRNVDSERPGKLAQAITLLSCIWEVPGSSLDLPPGILTEVRVVCLSSPSHMLAHYLSKATIASFHIFSNSYSANLLNIRS